MNNYFVFSDLHGQGELYKQIKKFMADNPEAGFIYLGDACDRGENGYEIMKDMLANDDILYLKGNHEDMFVKAARAIRRMLEDENFIGVCDSSPVDLVYHCALDEDVNLHLMNGGMETLVSWIKDNMPMRIINELAKLPTFCEVENNEGVLLTFSHAGFREEENAINERIWSRNHFGQKWSKGVMIHGHTPVMSSHLSIFTDKSRKELYENPEPLWYANNTKLDIDTGCFSTKVIYLVNIHTMEMIKFCEE